MGACRELALTEILYIAAVGGTCTAGNYVKV
jgi:hypothetical protein